VKMAIERPSIKDSDVSTWTSFLLYPIRLMLS
jgi:hypothetical protein